jgi:hypothetical protein
MSKKVPTKKPTIGSTAIAAIQSGKTDEEILALVKKVHPKSRTSKACVSWYRGYLKKQGKLTKKAQRNRPRLKLVKK